jgi:hypothetical protein
MTFKGQAKDRGPKNNQRDPRRGSQIERKECFKEEGVCYELNVSPKIHILKH